MTSRRHRVRLTLGLMLLAPTVGEFLLGNIAISQYLGSVLVLLPLYGAGALLVRESARRLGGGWATIVLFAAAYALIEEGPVDQMVFNPGYLGLHSFAGYLEVPGLDISLTLVLWSLALHTVWSICIPIALVETFDPTPTEPWWGPRGLAVTASVFVLGCVFLGGAQAHDLGFVGTATQFATSGVAIVALVGVGVLVRRAPFRRTEPRAAPHPATVGVAAFALTSTYWLSTSLPGGHTPALTLASWLVAVAVAVLAVGRWSRRAGWDGRHRLALAAGGAATYALWFGPSQALEAGTGPVETAVGAVVFGGAMVALVLAARHSLSRHSPIA